MSKYKSYIQAIVRGYRLFEQCYPGRRGSVIGVLSRIQSVHAYFGAGRWLMYPVRSRCNIDSHERRTCVDVKIILAGSIDPNAARWHRYENQLPEQAPAGRILLSRFPAMDKARSISLIAISLSVLIGCEKANDDFIDSPIRSFENQVGTRFSEVRSFDFKPPEVHASYI